MANYDDYQLDEMEDAAVNKSKNLKRGLLAGAGVLGVGGTAAFAAHQMNSGSEDDVTLTSEDLLEGANAASDNVDEAIGGDAAEQAQPAQQTIVKEVNHTYVVENQGEAHGEEGTELEVNVRESSVLFDEDGNIVSTIDAGTVNGKDFVVMDTDLNGKGDVLAYDANGNGYFEDNEIVTLDNQEWEMGKGESFHAYARTESGDIVEVFTDGDGTHDDGDIADIHNDFDDERTGEYYSRDLADNNPDYQNEDNQRVGFEGSNDDLAQNDYDDSYGIEPEQEFAYEDGSYEEPVDYGYNETSSDDMASFDGGAETFDDTFEA